MHGPTGKHAAVVHVFWTLSDTRGLHRSLSLIHPLVVCIWQAVISGTPGLVDASQGRVLGGFPVPLLQQI